MVARNDAPAVNAGIGGTALSQITVRGSNWFWAVCAVMAFSTFLILGASYARSRSHRLFHYICAAITLTAAISYFSMASNLGQTPIQTQFVRPNPKVGGIPGGTREIFYVRYIDWFVTTPLLLLDLLLTAGMPWPTILWTLFLDEVMIVTGLVGALTRSSYKWGFFAFGCAALLGVAYNVTIVARKHANALGSDVHRVFLSCAVWTFFLWFLYPIAWGLAEGGNVIAPDSEAVFYGILDILAKPVFSLLLLWGHRKIEPARLGVLIRDYNELPDRSHEKPSHNGVDTGVMNGASTTV
ncbi:MAG: hypothetical protein Q9187_007202 [Circinaria calcarea]